MDARRIVMSFFDSSKHWKALLFLMLLMPACAKSQIHTPYKWNFNSTEVIGTEAELSFVVTLDKSWHIYAQHIGSGGPVPTKFTFDKSSQYEMIGEVRERSPAIKGHSDVFMMDLVWYEGTVTFTQRVKINSPATEIKGKIEFMLCTDEMCLPPDEVEFKIAVEVKIIDQTKVVRGKTPVALPENTVEKKVVATASADTAAKSPVISTSTDEINTQAHAGFKNSLWAVFLAGFLGGLAAIFMPCIFPMLPITVGFFSKQAGSKRSAIMMSAGYGLSIIIIYVALGLLITILFGSDALNALSTNGAFNFLYFLLMLVFAASFLGAFEISLPHSWANRMDAKASTGSWLGIMFMAITLVLVSFSCTGPIIGTLLVETAASGNMGGPAIGMLGFAIALALPFTLFSLFPSWLKALPKSGSWLNSVKVVLGFLEIALALKFLSNVDLAYHWNWFDREVFLVLWIITFAMLGFYLLGKIRFPHDSPLQHLSPYRAGLAIITLAFSLYMVPGLWGAPLKAIAAFLPPQHSQDFDLYTANIIQTSGQNGIIPVVQKGSTKRYSDIFHAPHNLNAFFDYEEGMNYAKSVNKPVLIDFTGHACVNCRKMEMVVWSDPTVLRQLQHDYVLIQLYVDDKTELPQEEQFTSAYSNKQVKTIGAKWSDFQAHRFNTNSQPWYVLLDENGKELAQPQGADYDIEAFASYLREGLTKFVQHSKATQF
jgi:thiol:disulfide interchange protein